MGTVEITLAVSMIREDDNGTALVVIATSEDAGIYKVLGAIGDLESAVLRARLHDAVDRALVAHYLTQSIR